MNRLLKRQFSKAGVQSDDLSLELRSLLRQVEASYDGFEADRRMLERSLDLSSQELLAASAETRASEELLRRTLQATADGILAVDSQGTVLHVNARYFEILELPNDLFEIVDIDERLAAIAGRLTDPAAFIERMRAIRSGEITESLDILTLKSGRVVERSSRPLAVLNGPSGRVWSYRDITERHQLEEQLRHQAFHDPLTGLANRARFTDRVEHALERSQRSGCPVHVLFVDIDNFKAVNDTLGHGKGDETIRVVGERISRAGRPGDTAARLGGDEFGLVLEDLSNPEAAQTLAEGLLEIIRQPIQIDNLEIVVDASIGIAMSHGQSTTDSLTRNADIAMYSAKNKGKGRQQAYEPGMHARLSERQTLIADLRQGLQRGELTVHYQPSIVLSTGALAGAEALVRWNHPTRGMVQPDAFILLAEESGLISDVGEFVLREATTLLRDWQADSRTADFLLGVNVSPRQIRARDFVTKMRRILDESGIDPGGLMLELTESAMLEDPEHVLLTLTGLKELGVKLALDDFGTGYSSLSYLKRFPIDVLKIDKSFIGDMNTSEQGALLAMATIGFGQQLKLSVLAEGIEREDQLTQLQGLDCDLGQGFLFSYPLPRRELDAFVVKSLEMHSELRSNAA